MPGNLLADPVRAPDDAGPCLGRNYNRIDRQYIWYTSPTTEKIRPPVSAPKPLSTKRDIDRLPPSKPAIIPAGGVKTKVDTIIRDYYRSSVQALRHHSLTIPAHVSDNNYNILFIFEGQWLTTKIIPSPTDLLSKADPRGL